MSAGNFTYGFFSAASCLHRFHEAATGWRTEPWLLEPAKWLPAPVGYELVVVVVVVLKKKASLVFTTMITLWYCTWGVE